MLGMCQLVDKQCRQVINPLESEPFGAIHVSIVLVRGMLWCAVQGYNVRVN